MFITKGSVTSKAYSTTRTIAVGPANRVYPFTFNDTGTNGDQFWGRAATYIVISKSLGSGTYTLYRNGAPFVSWPSSGNPPRSENFPDLNTDLKWYVEIETRYNQTFESEIDAENWGRGQKTELQGLYHNTTTNIWTISVVQ